MSGPYFAELLPTVPDWAGWLTFVFALLAGIGLALGLALLIAPVTALIAGLFLDDVAEVIEKRDYASRFGGYGHAYGQGNC